MTENRELCPKHEALLDHTARAIVAIASAAHPHDPIAATRLALAAVGLTATIRPRADRPMDTSDLDPETGEEWGVIPDGEVWVVLTGARDRFSGRSSFTAYWTDGQRDYLMKLATFEAWQGGAGRTVRVLTAQQAGAFHSHRTAVTS